MATFAAAYGARLSSLAGRAARAIVRAPQLITRTHVGFVAGAICAMPAATPEDFFEHKFITTKDPDAIVDFYSTEDFLQILGIFPMAIHFVLAGVEWDTDRENTMSVHNAMEISFTLEEREEETDSGETVVAFFQKRERFKNFIPFTRFIMWDQVQCYGYNRREDGSCEVFHRGETFTGPLPIRLLVQLHAMYVIWATEKHINSPAFGAGDLEAQEHQRSNIPLHAFTDFLHRLSIAHQIAIESGKLAAGASTAEAEKTLATLQRMQETPTDAYVRTMKRANLARRVSRVEVEDPEAQRALDAAMATLSNSKEGQAAAAAAMTELVGSKKGRVEEWKEPRYGGAFKGRVLKTMTSNA